MNHAIHCQNKVLQLLLCLLLICELLQTRGVKCKFLNKKVYTLHSGMTTTFWIYIRDVNTDLRPKL